jgi:hypothetical protein
MLSLCHIDRNVKQKLFEHQKISKTAAENIALACAPSVLHTLPTNLERNNHMYKKSNKRHNNLNQTNRQSNKQTNKQTNTHTHKQTNQQTNAIYPEQLRTIPCTNNITTSTFKL